MISIELILPDFSPCTPESVLPTTITVWLSNGGQIKEGQDHVASLLTQRAAPLSTRSVLLLVPGSLSFQHWPLPPSGGSPTFSLFWKQLCLLYLRATLIFPRSAASDSPEGRISRDPLPYSSHSAVVFFIAHITTFWFPVYFFL